MTHVITELSKTHNHRIYIVDQNNVPIRVLSLRNVLMKFVKEPRDYFGTWVFYNVV